MKASQAATRYAKSLLQLSLETGTLEACKTDMQLVGKTIAENRELATMLVSPIIKPDVKKRVLDKVFSAHVSKLSMEFMSLITNKGREKALAQIALAFVEEYNQHKGIVTAEVSTATPLTSSQREQIMAALTSSGRAIDLRESVHPGLIGGMAITVGDQRIDASVRRKLNDLKTEISNHKFSAI